MDSHCGGRTIGYSTDTMYHTRSICLSVYECVYSKVTIKELVANYCRKV